jgi:hypothetical protein
MIMATIKQFGGQGFSSNFASIVLENDAEVTNLPINKVDSTKTPLQDHKTFSVGSEAFCPSSGNAFMLTEAGWIKL